MSKEQRIVFTIKGDEVKGMDIQVQFYPKLAHTPEARIELPIHRKQMQFIAASIGEYVMAWLQDRADKATVGSEEQVVVNVTEPT